MRKINKLARIVGTVAVGGAAAMSALAITPGTFGGFTSATSNPGNSVSSGTLTMTNSANNAAVVTATTGLALNNLKPGDTASGSVTITNSGTLPADMTLSISNASNTFPGSTMNLLIKDGTTTVYNGNVANTASPIALGATWAAGDAHTYNVTLTFASSADNTAQGKSASFELDWNGAQH
jgi:spore coat-associated protein N